MIASRDTIQRLACDALNIWRDHVLVLADACEERGDGEHVHEADALREEIGELWPAVPVDHHATRDKQIMLESVARRLMRLARPRFYLAKGTRNKRLRLSVWTRHQRKVVYSFEPTDVVIVDPPHKPRREWESHTARFTLNDELIELHLTARIIEGCVMGENPDANKQAKKGAKR